MIQERPHLQQPPIVHLYVNAVRLIVLYCFQVSGSKQAEELSLVHFDQPGGRVDCGTNVAFGKRREP